MPNSKTPTQTPFPSFATEQESNPAFSRYIDLPTPTSMRSTVLFGLPLRSFMTNEPLPDSTIQHYIDEAVSEVEHTLDMYIAPVTFQERHDYSRHLFFWSFGYMKVNHGPILDVSRFQLSFNNGQGAPGSVPLVDIPLEFVHVQPQDQTLQLVPAQGVSISGLIVSIYSGLGFHAFNSQALSYWPGAILVEYRAGFENGKVPALLAGLIENLAAYKMLSIMGPLFFPHNSVSIGIDGTSQSVGTLGPAFLKQRMDELDKIVQQQLDTAKGYYQKKFMIDFI
jgi:hypothetical protein